MKRRGAYEGRNVRRHKDIPITKKELSPKLKTFFLEIRSRSNGVSEKVKEHVLTTFLPKLKVNAESAPKLLRTIKRDFHDLNNNPSDNDVGAYSDWTAEEVRELYFVLYGESLE